MINNINLKDYAGYLYATIDNQTKPLNLKEIEKDEVTIVNLASTGIPLYTSIPICVRLDTAKNNIIEKGLLKIKIIERTPNKDIIHYEDEGSIVNGKYQTNIDKNLNLGTYIIDIYYTGGKFFNAAQLQYYLTIERRPILFDIQKTQYHGKPYEDVNIHLEMYDALNRIPITNIRVDYIYNKTHYITKSDNEGGIDFQITVPDTCEGDSIVLYVENEVYEYTKTQIDILVDRLETKIGAYHSFEDNNIVIYGNVLAYNNDIMYDTQYGDIGLYIDDELVDADNVEDSVFELRYNYEDYLSEYSNTDDTVVNEQGTIGVNTELQVKADSIPGEVKFTVKVTDFNDKKVLDGMVYFEFKNNKNQFIQELDENGEAICYFYISEANTYKIRYKYYGIFEYEDSEMKEEMIEVQ